MTQSADGQVLMSSLVAGFPGRIRQRYQRQDETIVRDVWAKDCYRVRDLPFPARSIVDVGAHIGIAALKFRERFTDAEIVSVEPEAGNFATLVTNVGSDPRIHCFQSALTYEQGPLVLHGSVYEGTVTTGGSFVGSPEAYRHRPNAHEYRTHTPVDSMSIEQVLERTGWERIDVLKLDCEGSELSILEHAPIERIGVVVGEWHHRQRLFDIVGRRFRRQDGWDFDILREGRLGLFRLGQQSWWNR